MVHCAAKTPAASETTERISLVFRSHTPSTGRSGRLDQWFSESQFQSYRALGFHILEQLAGGLTNTSFHEFHASVDSYINNPP